MPLPLDPNRRKICQSENGSGPWRSATGAAQSAAASADAKSGIQTKSENQEFPLPRLTDRGIYYIGRDLEMWALLGNPSCNQEVSIGLTYDEDFAKYAKQGKLFRIEAHRAGNCA